MVGETTLHISANSAEPLPQWLRRLSCDLCILGDLGSTLFTSVDALINSGRIFVQTKIASSQSHGLDPEAIFALFLICLESNIQFKCCQVMVEAAEHRGAPPSSEGSVNGTVETWAPLIVSVQMALSNVRPVTNRVLYRGVSFQGRGAAMLDLLKNYHDGARISWTPFTSCTPVLNVAAPWMHDRDVFGVIFMIRACKNAKAVSDFTLNPWQSEAMYAAGSAFKVTARMQLDAALHPMCGESRMSVPGHPVDLGFVDPPRLKRSDLQTVHDLQRTPIVVVELEEL